ncbi:DUF2789 domain-containing protein [Acinetobacter variabilis]|jgi:Protein of unknown function (DUF2789).|uniref:DUF2789 domain-containing protein n=1 Tax=Acinetobacter variabilis TaxID=70346 RepID=N9MRZ8_9GAMM|nr:MULTISPECIES: DUF2789 domain-containing protein [Acinetobacter]HAB43789.1 DUF2789 domain-containing protein [Acinetobacter sp.]ANF80964.1 hypothetical protein A3K93_01355 [Acinetobacter sp. NCu2D-2]AUX91248.1 DUF2789 domain-containing protein [Acinetobacter sp. ACNIH1]ENX11364.1 hypothetical protein F897_00205 [Acinetobacter variabilis]MBO3659978.1 DUF2789 domain-containing protein [Acinetobacter variabilis]
MTQVRPRMTHLFAQLGLDSSAEGIAQFIHEHQLPKDVNLMEAPYWSDAQRQFLAEKIASDGEWAIVVDQLNESLHEDATSGIE